MTKVRCLWRTDKTTAQANIHSLRTTGRTSAKPFSYRQDQTLSDKNKFNQLPYSSIFTFAGQS